MRRTTRTAERASVTPLLAAVVAVVMIAVVGTSRIGSAAVARARVEATADLAALAATGGGRADAAVVARIAGADVAGLEQRSDGTVQVTVVRDGSRATAAARLVPATGGARDLPAPRR